MPLMDMDFVVTSQLVRPRMPLIRFLFIGPYVCSTLLSDPASRRRPCASLSLRLHQVVKRTFTFELSNMLGTLAVGTTIAGRPPHRSVRARLRIRLLPRMNGVEALIGIRMQNTRLRNPPVQQWVETIPPHLGALTATNQDASPQPANAPPEDAQLTRVAGHSMVLVITLHNLPKPSAHLTRAMVLPVLKLIDHSITEPPRS